MRAIPKQFENIPRGKTKVFPPVGRCIYCGATDVPLSREHIIPFALGGNLILPKASCNACADVTKQFEQICLRGVLNPVRTVMNLPTRRPKERPTVLHINRVNPDQTLSRMEFPVAQCPKHLVLPQLMRPGILEGASPSPVLRFDTWFGFDTDDMQTFTAKYGETVVKPERFPIGAFGLMLAKIGHSFAVAIYGVDGFKPLLLDLIFGRYKTPSYLIGGGPGTHRDPHETHYIEAMRTPLGNITYVVINCQLFAVHGAPIYNIVAGIYQGTDH